MSTVWQPAAKHGDEPVLPPPRLFGTDGIRMIVGREFTPPFVAEVGSALGGYLKGTGTVVIGRDFRTSSEAMSRILAGSLLMHGVSVRDLGVMPTPCVQFNVKALNANIGLTVTASHNPTEFNGIKFTGPEGMELHREEERSMEGTLHTRRFPLGSWDRVGSFREDPDGIDRYLTSIMAHTDVPAIQRWAPTVVLDCGNGTSLTTSPTLMRSLGAGTITLNANPDGYFSGRPSEPSEENLGALKKAVVSLGANLGVAHDGDSDRVAFIDEKGRYIPGEVALAVFAKARLLEKPHATIVTSITSSSAVADVVRGMGGKFVVTRSGSLPVATGVIENSGNFAGEENGGYYWPEHQVARDGPMSSAKMLELIAHQNRPLSELVDEIPTYFLIKAKVPLARQTAAARAIKERVVHEAELHLAQEADRLLTIDGVKAFFSDGWLLILPSGTEPICRVFAESANERRAQELLERGVAIVRDCVPPGTELPPK